MSTPSRMDTPQGSGRSHRAREDFLRSIVLRSAGRRLAGSARSRGRPHPSGAASRSGCLAAPGRRWLSQLWAGQHRAAAGSLSAGPPCPAIWVPITPPAVPRGPSASKGVVSPIASPRRRHASPDSAGRDLAGATAPNPGGSRVSNPQDRPSGPVDPLLFATTPYQRGRSTANADRESVFPWRDCTNYRLRASPKLENCPFRTLKIGSLL